MKKYTLEKGSVVPIYDGGGVTIQSSLTQPGKVVHAPGAPELVFEKGVNFKTAYMYNIDKGGKETLIGVSNN